MQLMCVKGKFLNLILTVGDQMAIGCWKSIYTFTHLSTYVIEIDLFYNHIIVGVKYLTWFNKGGNVSVVHLSCLS